MSENRVRFDRFVMDRDQRQLFEGETALHVSPKAFRLLDLLLTARPRALSKNEIQDDLWPNVFVSEVNLPTLVSELRSALADDARSPHFIRTVHGFGYAFCGEASAASRNHHNSGRGLVIVGGREIALVDVISVIVRDIENAITVDDVTVSRRHAFLRTTSEGAIVEDLGSKNGTFVGGVRIVEPTAVRNGESFTVGAVDLIFRLPGGSTSTVTFHRS